MTFVDVIGASAVELCEYLCGSVRIEGAYLGVPHPDLHANFYRARLPGSRAVARELLMQWTAHGITSITGSDIVSQHCGIKAASRGGQETRGDGPCEEGSIIESRTAFRRKIRGETSKQHRTSIEMHHPSAPDCSCYTGSLMQAFQRSTRSGWSDRHFVRRRTGIRQLAWFRRLRWLSCAVLFRHGS